MQYGVFSFNESTVLQRLDDYAGLIDRM